MCVHAYKCVNAGVCVRVCACDDTPGSMNFSSEGVVLMVMLLFTVGVLLVELPSPPSISKAAEEMVLLSMFKNNKKDVY